MDALPNLPPSPLADHIIAALRTQDEEGRGVVLPWFTWTNGTRFAARAIGGKHLASCFEGLEKPTLEQQMAAEDARLRDEGYLLAEDVVREAVASFPPGKVLGDIVAHFEERAAWTRARARAWKHAAKKAYRIARHNGREVDRAGVYIALLRSRHGAMPAEAAQDALANIAQWLTAQGMKNNASVVCNLPDLGRVTLSVQRHEGKTPNDMIDEAQAESAALREQLARVTEERDEMAAKRQARDW